MQKVTFSVIVENDNLLLNEVIRVVTSLISLYKRVKGIVYAGYEVVDVGV
jgi:hypothetical protein